MRVVQKRAEECSGGGEVEKQCFRILGLHKRGKNPIKNVLLEFESFWEQSAMNSS